MRSGGIVAGLAAIALLAVPARGLETDQFYAWARPLNDSAIPVNEHINAGIAEALSRVNARHHATPCACRVARDAIFEEFNYAIIARPEMWATKSALVDRIPATADEATRFRTAYLYGGTFALDPILWMPASPTIAIAGVRMGTDKLGHFFDDGAWAEGAYRHAIKRGDDDAVAMRKAVDFSIATERTIWGRGTSGVMSLSDLEANYQGLLFYRGLCDGPDPALELTSAGWRLKRPFDVRAYVSPKWDESWEPNVYTRWRWSKVRPVMKRYCDLLRSPDVAAQRAAYAARDRETPVEAAVHALVAAGRIPDPRQFTIEAACGLPASEPRSGSGR
jgi:hypothetical protein